MDGSGYGLIKKPALAWTEENHVKSSVMRAGIPAEIQTKCLLNESRALLL
jgi:hypothetical protein